MHDALAVRGSERSGDLVHDGGGAIGVQRSVLEQVLEAPAAQQPHDQVRAVGVAPVVVQGHHVWMFQACHELRLVLEATHEVGLVRELGMDRLDRDLAADLRLDRSVDESERALPDLFEQPVAAGGVRP